jgi:hypothetical protein
MISEMEGSDTGTMGSRDPGRERAPRSMMACEFSSLRSRDGVKHGTDLATYPRRAVSETKDEVRWTCRCALSGM